MSHRDEKKPAEAKKALPAEAGWQFSFGMTRPAGDEGAEAAPWSRRLGPLELALIAAGLAIFLLEPVAGYMLMTHMKGPLVAEGCAPSNHVLVVDAVLSPAAELPDPAAQKPGEGSDVITPLNTRDPSALIMGPGR